MYLLKNIIEINSINAKNAYCFREMQRFNFKILTFFFLYQINVVLIMTPSTIFKEDFNLKTVAKLKRNK